MTIRVEFYSYFRELAGCLETTAEVPAGATLAVLLEQLYRRYPRLRPMRRSTLMAVGVEYQAAGYTLREGDAVSLFPPVQGG